MGHYASACGTFIFLLLFFVIGAALVPPLHNFLGTIFNVSYMLPRPARVAVVEVTGIEISYPYADTHALRVTGRVAITPGAQATDYRVVIYIRTKVEKFSKIKNGTKAIVGHVLEDGRFTLNNITLDENSEPASAFLVVIRESDIWRNSQFELPREVDDHEDPRIMIMNAYTVIVPEAWFIARPPRVD